MTTGLKLYSAILAAIILVVVAVTVYQPAQVRELNALLKQDQALSHYPYPFRVLQVENATAVMSSPRSARVSVPEIIGIIDPSLQGVALDDGRFFAAQQQLATLQGRAKKLVLAQPEISRVRWQLDEAWLRNHGLMIND